MFFEAFQCCLFEGFTPKYSIRHSGPVAIKWINFALIQEILRLAFKLPCDNEHDRYFRLLFGRSFLLIEHVGIFFAASCQLVVSIVQFLNVTELYEFAQMKLESIAGVASRLHKRIKPLRLRIT